MATVTPRGDTAAPLRRDVRLLGTILGTVLVEQEGEWLLELVEAIRRDARSARADRTIASTASSLTAEQQALVLRAFGLYFQLANLAEQHHRLRRRREDAHDGVVARESLEDAFQQLAGVPTDELAGRAATTSIRLVLTAHPTEATRRTVLLAHIRIAEQLVKLDDPRLAPDERSQAEGRLAEEVTILWQTDEVRHDRLRISDEIRNGLWFFEHSLISAATDLLHAWRLRVPGGPPPLTFGSWIGGDMDGNPAAGPASIAEALDEARRVALRRYRDEVRALAVEIASTRSLVRISDELEASLARDEAELPEYATEIGARNELEPYRRKLSFMWWRLEHDRVSRARRRCSRISARSARAWPRTAAVGSPTGELRGSSEWSSSSASTWRSSTCGCMPAISPSRERGKRSRQQSRRAAATALRRSTR